MVKERGGIDDQWIYVHDPSVQVGRIQNFTAWSPAMAPDSESACFGLEYFCYAGRDGLWGMSDRELEDLARRELAQLGWFGRRTSDACVVRQKSLPGVMTTRERVDPAPA
jgi:protoporphyrinogen oxidase